MKSFSYLLPLLLLIQSGLCLARGGVDGAERGGGDPVALEFTQYGEAIAQDLDRWPNSILTLQNRRDFLKAVREFPVVQIEGEIKDSAGISVTAVTDLEKKQIEIARERWIAIGPIKQHEKIAIVFHEYMRAAGLGSLENTYALTTEFMKYVKAHSSSLLSSALQGNNDQTFKLATLLRGKKIVCSPKGGTDPRAFVITATGSKPGQAEVNIRYSNDDYYLSPGKTEPSFALTQIVAGQSLLLSMSERVLSTSERATNVLRFDSPTQIGCGWGTESFAPRSGAKPNVRVINCCLHQ